MILTSDDLHRMKSVDVRTVKIEDLVDIRDIKVDTRKSIPEKLQQFASQTNNVFINRFDDYIVKVSYADTDVTVNDKMKKYISRLAEISY